MSRYNLISDHSRTNSRRLRHAVAAESALEGLGWAALPQLVGLDVAVRYRISLTGATDSACSF